MGIVASQLVAEVKVTGDAEAKAKLRSVGETNDSVGSKIKTALGGSAIIAGTAAIAAGVASLKMAGDFNSATTTLVTGAGESQKNLNMIRQGILSIGPATGETTKELTDGMFMIESAGQHGKQALDTLTAAAEGAKVGGADLASVANGVTTEMTDYASAHLTAAQATNDLIATVASGKTHMQDLATAMSTILPTSAAVHVSLTDVSGAMATMTGEGTNAAAAATYLRQLLLALESPASKGASALKNIGLTAGQVSADMKQSLPATLKLITDRLAATYGEGSPKYVAALKDIAGGSRQMQGILELTGTHLTTFKTNVLNIADAVKKGGSSISGWALVQQQFNQKLDQGREIVETLGITFGEKLIPVASEGIDLFSKFATSLNDTSSPIHQLTGDIEKFGTNIFTTAEKSGAFQSVFKTISDTLPTVEQDIGLVGGAVEQLLPPTLSLIGNFSTWIDKSGILTDGLHLLGDGVTTVSNVLTPVIQDLSNLFEWLSENKPATDALKTSAVLLGIAFVGLKIGNTVTGFAQMFTKMTEGKTIIEGLADTFKNKFGGAVNEFLGTHAPNVKKAFGDIGGAAKGAGENVASIGTNAEISAGKVTTASLTEEDDLNNVDLKAKSLNLDMAATGTGGEAGAGVGAGAGAVGAGAAGGILSAGAMIAGVALAEIGIGMWLHDSGIVPTVKQIHGGTDNQPNWITHHNPNDDLAKTAQNAKAIEDSINKAWQDMESLYGDAEKRGQLLGDLSDPRKMDATDVKIQQIKEHLDDLGKPVIIKPLTPEVVAARLKIIDLKSHLDDLKGPVDVGVKYGSVNSAILKIDELKSHLDDLPSPSINVNFQIPKEGFHGHASGILNNPVGHIGLVGERGPELMYVPQGASIFPNSQTQHMLGASLMDNMQVIVHVHPPDISMDGHIVTRQLMPHIANVIGNAVNSTATHPH